MLITDAVDRVKAFYRNLTIDPSNDEEEDNNFQLANKYFHFIHYFWTVNYYLMNKLTILQKCIIFIATPLLVLSGYLYYFVILFSGRINFDIEEILFFFVPILMHMAAFVAQPMFFIFFEDEIIAIKKYISTFKEKFNPICPKFKVEGLTGGSDHINSNIHMDDVFNKENALRTLFFSYGVSMPCSVIYMMYPAVVRYFWAPKNDFYTANDYYTIFPFYDRIESPTLYFVLSTLSSIFGVYEGVVVIAFMMTQFGIIYLIRQTALYTCRNIHILSQNFVVEYTKSLLTEEIEYEPNIDFKNQLVLEFEQDLMQLLQEYKRFSMSTRRIEKLLNFYLNAIILLGIGGMFGVTAVLIMIKMELVIKMRFFATLIIMANGLYTCCSMGEILIDIQNMYRSAVYALPWFYLPPKTRKTVNIFQNWICNHPEFKIFGFYSVSMALFPKLWSNVYSYANILLKVSK